MGDSSGLNELLCDLVPVPSLSGTVSSPVTGGDQGFSCSDILSSMSLQTTIMAVEFDGGVVVGSDSRVSAG